MDFTSFRACFFGFRTTADMESDRWKHESIEDSVFIFYSVPRTGPGSVFILYTTVLLSAPMIVHRIRPGRQVAFGNNNNISISNPRAADLCARRVSRSEFRWFFSVFVRFFVFFFSFFRVISVWDIISKSTRVPPEKNKNKNIKEKQNQTIQSHEIVFGVADDEFPALEINSK